MLFFPHAKINIGLYVTGKRPDGFHNIETLIYPIGLCDAVEFIVNKKSDRHHFTYSGLTIQEDNELCARLVEALTRQLEIPPLAVHIHKHIPPGSGLGGGSSDAAFLLRNLVDYFHLPLKIQDQHEIALNTGNDCPFFLYGRPMIATGRGEILTETKVNLAGYHLVVVMPDIQINTRQAYLSITPVITGDVIPENHQRPPGEWKEYLKNHFEEVLFPQYPVLEKIRQLLYAMGAVYASMTGSGSAIYGIFREAVEVPDSLKQYPVYKEMMR